MESGGDEEPPCSGDPQEEEEQRMSSSSPCDPEQHMAAALRRQTPAAAAPAGAGGGAPDRAAVVAALQRRKAAQRARATTDVLSAEAARSLADQTFSRREQLKGLKHQLRDLQSQLSEALALHSRKESKRKFATESVSETTAKNQRLHNLVAEYRVKRDLFAAIKSQELQALESLEAASNEGTEKDEIVSKTLLWFDKFLGFQVIGGEGAAKFVFDKIDPQRPEKEYSFRISERFEFIECDPHVKDIEELAKDLDLSKHLFMFVRMAREKFHSSFMNGTLPLSPVVGPDVSAAPLPLPLSPVVGPDVSAAPLPSPMVKSINSTSEDAHSQSQPPRKNSVQLLPAKRGATALSGLSPGVLRRSPRLEGTR